MALEAWFAATKADKEKYGENNLSLEAKLKAQRAQTEGQKETNWVIILNQEKEDLTTKEMKRTISFLKFTKSQVACACQG